MNKWISKQIKPMLQSEYYELLLSVPTAITDKQSTVLSHSNSDHLKYTIVCRNRYYVLHVSLSNDKQISITAIRVLGPIAIAIGGDHKEMLK